MSAPMPSAACPRPALILVEALPVPFDRVRTEAKTLRDARWRMTVVSPQGRGGRSRAGAPR
jgi:hypothetical protein